MVAEVTNTLLSSSVLSAPKTEFTEEYKDGGGNKDEEAPPDATP